MASTTALFTAMTGLNANARNIDVIGNNIANVNTTAYKSSRLLFSTMFSRTLSSGTPPGDTTGGTNPYQIGLGVRTAGTQRSAVGGTIAATGDQRDLAIDGNGYFVVHRGEDRLFTRAGAFRTNSQNQLTTISGERLQGYGVDDQFNITPGVLSDITIPLGGLTLAQATRNIRFSGNLDADGALPGQGSRTTLGGTAIAGLVAVGGASPAPSAPNVLESSTRLVDIEDPALPASGAPLFASGQTLEIRGAERGGKTVPTASLAITSSTTVAQLNTFLTEVLGLSTGAGANPDGRTPGVALDPATGVITIDGNTGTVNDLAIETSDLRLSDSAGALIRYPFVSAKAASADGESVRTTFVVYDSLGAAVEVDLAMVLDARTSTGTTWRYYVDCADAEGDATAIQTGTLAFDTQGQPVSALPVNISIDRGGTGADTPLDFAVAFAGGTDAGVTSLADDRSVIAATYRDGAPIGTLAAFGVGADGVITGAFTNGMTRALGQVALATFANEEGLLDAGDNMFRVAANSGTAAVVDPGTLGAGYIVGGALEQSNVDLGEEFIKLVLSSTGYSANSRVIRTTEELMQQLLVLGR